MGRYHARLLHATRLELHAAVIHDPGHDGLSAFMAGYLATPGVAAGLGCIEACTLQPAAPVPDEPSVAVQGGEGWWGEWCFPLPRALWILLALHLTRLSSISATIVGWGTPALACAEDLVTLLPASAHLCSLAVRWREPVPPDGAGYDDDDDDDDGWRRVDRAGQAAAAWLQQLCSALHDHGHGATITRLSVPSMDTDSPTRPARAIVSSSVFSALAKALPAVEVLEVSSCCFSDTLQLTDLLGGAPHVAITADGGAAVEPSSAGGAAPRWPHLRALRGSQLTASLAELDAACAARPALRAIHGLHVNLTPGCMLRQAARPHVEQLAVAEGPIDWWEVPGPPHGLTLRIKHRVESDAPRGGGADGGDGQISDRDGSEACWWGLCGQAAGMALPAVLTSGADKTYLHLSLSQRIMTLAPAGPVAYLQPAVLLAIGSHAGSGQEAGGGGGVRAADQRVGGGHGSGGGRSGAGGGEATIADATPQLLQDLARLLRPVQQSPARGHFSLNLTYQFKSDGSETRAAAQDALMTACRALQPSIVSVDVVGRHSRSPNPSDPHASASTHSSGAATHGSRVEEEAAWVRFARRAAAALPSLQEMREVGGLWDMWGSVKYLRWPMLAAFRAARPEEA